MAVNNNVSVAVRIRPKLQKETIDMCNICTRVSPGEPQVWLGHDKAFTFDNVFDIDSKQGDVYDNCVRTLVEGCFEGYNATVLAYGQTGSGKTYTMGTGFDVSCPEDQLGIIPRAVNHLFEGIQLRKEQARQNDLPLPEFSVVAQFIEIYNEELKDLLCEKSKKGAQIRIQEDVKRGIILTGVENKPVSSIEETLACLKNGSLFRTTGATLMNAESSRSHAIFTLFIKQSRVDRIETNESENGIDQELITLTAKFNFVDLAGSERLSRTGAVGERAREGISINSGLLHLGNVISALGDRSKKASHIPYRDSKLTRVLQDSLGGNSVTTMIACISPCDRDFVETLNTLRYANRAKNIKNKVVANQDSQTQLINELRKQVMQLELENKELRLGKLFVKNDGELELNYVHLENEMLQRDLNNANIRIKALNTRLEELSNENISLQEKIAMGQIFAANGEGGGEDAAERLIKGYLKEINDLRSKVIEFEQTISYYRKQLSQRDNEILFDQNGLDIIAKSKQEIEMSKSRVNQLNSPRSMVEGEEVNEEENEDFEENDEDEIDEEFEQKIAGQKSELATLLEMIASKEKLIEEAEARQRRIIELTEHYEKQITNFQTKIKQTEDERDQLMSKLKHNKDDLSSKKVKDEYEKKIIQFQRDLKKYEALKREHQVVIRNETQTKELLKKMRNEVLDAKQQRVKLISQMNSQRNKHNKEIQENKIVINKLTREDQKKDVKIRDLVLQSNRQKMMLQRRGDEIKALRKQVKPAMSDKAAGRFLRINRGVSGHTPQKARNKWVNFEQKFNQLITQRISFEQEEKKLERYLQERQHNLGLINTLKENVDTIDNSEYIESVQTNVDYLTQCIEDTQNVITQLEDDNINTDQLFSNLDSDEVMYILNKLANTAVNYAIVASQKEEELKDKDARLSNLWNENVYSNHLLSYMVSKNFDEDLYPSNLAIPVSPLDLIPNNQQTPLNDKKLSRRLTQTPSELLHDMSRSSPQQSQLNALKPLDLNQTYVANQKNNQSNLKVENVKKFANDTFVKKNSLDNSNSDFEQSNITFFRGSTFPEDHHTCTDCVNCMRESSQDFNGNHSLSPELNKAPEPSNTSDSNIPRRSTRLLEKSIMRKTSHNSREYP